MFQPVSEPKFAWETIDTISFIYSLDATGCEVMLWIWSYFMVPRSSADKAFVSKLARLFHSVGMGSALESIASKAIFVVCTLVS